MQEKRKTNGREYAARDQDEIEHPPARNPPTPEDAFALNVMAEKKTFLAFPYRNFVFIHTIGDHGREKNIGGNYGSDKWVTYRAMKGNRRGLPFCGMGETPGYAYNSVS